MDTTQTPVSGEGKKVSQRLYSLDALRGFDLFWIIGADELSYRLAETTHSPIWESVAYELQHSVWNGFRMYDMIFPLFIFIAGVATPYSIANRLKKGNSKSQVLTHVIRRGLILVLFGILYNFGGIPYGPIDTIRFPSVLARIGLAYMFANIIFLYSKRTSQIIWCAGILIGYWLLLKFTSAPGFPMGDLTMEGSFPSYIDRTILPGRLYEVIHDPEGVLSTIPAIASALFGVFTGSFLKESKYSMGKKAGYMFVAGLVLIALAQLWSLVFPLNKNLWTSSFTLQCAGISLLFLSTFYYIIDVKGFKSWAFFFRVIGMNSILIYMSGAFIDWGYANKAIFGWLGYIVGKPYGVVVLSATFILTEWIVLYYLYKKKIFLKV